MISNCIIANFNRSIATFPTSIVRIKKKNIGTNFLIPKTLLPQAGYTTINRM